MNNRDLREYQQEFFLIVNDMKKTKKKSYIEIATHSLRKTFAQSMKEILKGDLQQIQAIQVKQKNGLFTF